MKKSYESFKLSLLYTAEEDIVTTSLAQDDCFTDFGETSNFNGWEGAKW